MFTWHWENNESLFSLYTIFFTFLILFSYGQCVMWALGIGLGRGIGSEVLIYGTNVIPSQEQLIQTKWYTCISMLLFHYGAIIFARHKNKNLLKRLESKDPERDRYLLFQIGCIVTVVVAPVAVFLRIKEYTIAMAYGYNALYYGEDATQSGYVQILMYLFFPGLICLLIGSSFSKRVVHVVFIIFGIYALFDALSGDRGGWLYSLIILLWLCMQRKKINFKKTLLWIGIGLVGIYFLQVITAARDNGGLSALTFNDYLSAFSADKSPIVDAFFEMGGTMSILTFFLIKGSGIYPYHNTYLVAILGALSSKLLSLLGIKQVLIGDWFSQEYLGLSWGTGFSMIGEAYVNGGYFGGWMYMFIIGILIGKLICMCRDNQDIVNHPLKAFVSVATVNIIMGFPRAASYLIVKNFVYGVLVILLLIYLMKQMPKRSMAKQK